ncbi:MAG: Flp pilus assembly complex ATPase component TadA [Candidatus Moranbacteria bacterium]|nr:Flp pilus assembly complex ATPase component TadA [Candidatus Moranbacteria bacterium]
MKIDNLHLYDYLLEQDLVSGHKLDEYFTKAQDKNIQLIEILVKEKIFSQSRMLRIIATVLGFKFIDLSQVKISNKIIKLIPKKTAEKFCAVAFEKKRNILKVATCDPEHSELFQFLKKRTKLKIEFYLAEKESIKKSLSQYVKKIYLADVSNDKLFGEVSSIDQKIDREEFIIRVVDVIISHAIIDLAGEIQIENKKGQTIICYRVDGELVEKILLPDDIFEEITEVIKIMAKLNTRVENFYQNGNFVIEKNNVETFFQVSIIPDLFTERIIIRLDDNVNDNLSLEKIGLAKNNVETIYKAIRKNHGMVLLSSPNGGGKTITFYTLLGLINSSDKNISTIEDPVEKNINKVNQIQVDVLNGINFKSGLFSIFNQDVDVIGVGEILDESTLETSLDVANSEKLVLATMYSNSAINVIQNIFELDVDLALVAKNINLIVSQRLVKKLCVHCREKYFLSEESVHTLGKKYDLPRIQKIIASRNDFDGHINLLESPFYKSKGCKKCGGSGYQGQLGIFEILKPSNRVRKLIARRERTEKIREIILAEGFETMIDDAFHKVVQGVTDFKEIGGIFNSK